MTDDVCESWEDVDVDKIVFKTSKTKANRPTYSSILSANTSNNSSNYFEIANSNNSATVTKFVDNFNHSTVNSNSNGFRIMQRAPEKNELPGMILDTTGENIAKGLRILNRPSKNNVSKNETRLKENEIQKQLKKSFEEKKAEYDKARLRIFGENMPSEDLMLNVTNALDSIHFSDKITTTQTTKTNFIREMIDNELLNGRNNLPIIRQPIGPDGTRGFRSGWPSPSSSTSSANK